MPWREWTPEAFSEARERGVPVLLFLRTLLDDVLEVERACRLDHGRAVGTGHCVDGGQREHGSAAARSCRRDERGQGRHDQPGDTRPAMWVLDRATLQLR